MPALQGHAGHVQHLPRAHGGLGQHPALSLPSPAPGALPGSLRAQQARPGPRAALRGSPEGSAEPGAGMTRGRAGSGPRCGSAAAGAAGPRRGRGTGKAREKLSTGRNGGSRSGRGQARARRERGAAPGRAPPETHLGGAAGLQHVLLHRHGPRAAPGGAPGSAGGGGAVRRQLGRARAGRAGREAGREGEPESPPGGGGQRSPAPAPPPLPERRAPPSARLRLPAAPPRAPAPGAAPARPLPRPVTPPASILGAPGGRSAQRGRPLLPREGLRVLRPLQGRPPRVLARGRQSLPRCGGSESSSDRCRFPGDRQGISEPALSLLVATTNRIAKSITGSQHGWGWKGTSGDHPP